MEGLAAPCTSLSVEASLITTPGGGSGGLTPEEDLHDGLAAPHRRSAVGLRRDFEEETFAEQAAAHVEVGSQCDAAEVAAVDIGDSVVFGEALVDESIVSVQQVDQATVFVDDAGEEQQRFFLEGVAQVVVEIGEGLGGGGLGVQAAEVQPLAGEVHHELLGSRVGQHAKRLALQHFGVAELVVYGQIHQLVVGDAAPQEERQAIGEFDIADPVFLARSQVGWLNFPCGR